MLADVSTCASNKHFIHAESLSHLLLIRVPPKALGELRLRELLKEIHECELLVDFQELVQASPIQRPFLHP